MASRRATIALANLLAAVWIFGGAALFFWRFSWAFYQANRAAVDGLLCNLLECTGLGP